MSEMADGLLIRTKVISILRKAPEPGQLIQEASLVDVIDHGPNIITKRGRHVIAALCAGGTQGNASGKPAGTNAYAQTEGWYLRYMSVGSGTAAADAANLTLDTETASSLVALTGPAFADETFVVPFATLNQDAQPYYTHIGWSATYGSGTGNGDINEVGLWISDGTTNPSGDVAGPSPTRGPLAARKVLSGTIEKTADFSLEFRWIWMF